MRLRETEEKKMAVIELTKKAGNSTLPARSVGIKTGTARRVDPNGKGMHDLTQGHIFIADGIITNHPAAERFRILKAQIERKNRNDKKFQIISIVSAIPQEGKSVVATNLARALGNDEKKRVLLIDCDLRKSTVHEYFDLQEGPGLSEVLNGRIEIGDAIRAVSPGLDVLTAGTPNEDPTALIEGPEFKAYLDELRAHYDYVVLDCPPALLCPEPITISSLTDATLLVLRAWKTDKRLVEDAVSVIGKQNILGAVVNGSFDTSKSYQTYDYYGYYKHAGNRSGSTY